MFEHQVDFAIIQLELMPARWLAGAAEYEVDGPVFFLEVLWGIFPLLIVILPGRVAPLWAPPGGSGTTRPVTVVAARSLGVIVLDDAIGERSALLGSVVCVLVPRTLAIQDPV